MKMLKNNIENINARMGTVSYSIMLFECSQDDRGGADKNYLSELIRIEEIWKTNRKAVIQFGERAFNANMQEFVKNINLSYVIMTDNKPVDNAWTNHSISLKISGGESWTRWEKILQSPALNKPPICKNAKVIFWNRQLFSTDDDSLDMSL